MADLHEIPAGGKFHRLSDESPVTNAEIEVAERRLGFSFPSSYREFLISGGLTELRINHRILSPAEIAENLIDADGRLFVPFADNGCGDLYGWQPSGSSEPLVVLADHETGEFLEDSASFTEWLSKHRF